MSLLPLKKPAAVQSVRNRLIRMQLSIVFLILTLSTLLFALNDLFVFKRSIERNLHSTSQILSRNLAPALSFGDRSEGEKVLSSLEAVPAIRGAAVYDADKALFAQFGTGGELAFRDIPVHLEAKGVHYLDGRKIIFFRTLKPGLEALGTLVLIADLEEFLSEYQGYALVVLFVLIACVLVARIAAQFMQKSLSRPIRELASTAKGVSDSGNYSLRVTDSHGGERIEEIHMLSYEFNRMLDQIQKRDQKILAANLDLEHKVQERTQELTQINQELDASLKKLEETQLLLLQSSKMSALGEMASGVAHEINNPLAIIKTLAGQLKELGQDAELDRDLFSKGMANIEGTVDRIAKIILGLRTFSRDGSRDPFQPASLRELVESTTRLCQERLKHNGIELRIGEIPEADFDCRATQISQVLLNLLNNAYDAIEKSTQPWVQISATDLGSLIEIRVMDSGSGIPPKIRDKVFQPFFTTKAVGKGTGIGLSVSTGIVASHQGSLRVDPDCKNTCFVLSLPKEQPMPKKEVAA